MLQKLPIGLQSFKGLRQDGYLYIDKTEHIYRLINSAKYNFLSRPRRFGKSLLMDTIHKLYAGEKELFHNLWIEHNWDWNKKKCPVIKISFGSGGINLEQLKYRFDDIIRLHKKEYDINLESKSSSGQLGELIIKLFKKHQKRVVVLVDEYDKPILDNINKLEQAIEIREELKNFYGVLKDLDEYLEFVLITGVSKFSKVSLFSGLNNLKDKSLDDRFGDICGYTEAEVKHYFSEYLIDGKVDFAKLQKWYNGFNFLGKNTVFNPYDVLNFFDNYEYDNYWFETATPTFLIKMIEKNKYYIPDIENIQAGDEIMKSFDIEKISLETLLFQSGYLTIDKRELVGNDYNYHLKYPNLEIKKSLTDHILSWLVEDKVVKQKNKLQFYHTLEAGKVAEFENVVKKILASLPYNWFVNNNMAKYEGYYCSVIYCYFYGLGLDVIAEDATSKGRIDLTLKLNNRIFIFEFKTEKSGKSAMEQIKERRYWEKYDNSPQSQENNSPCTDAIYGVSKKREGLSEGKTTEIYLVAMEFDEEKRELVKYEWEKV